MIVITTGVPGAGKSLYSLQVLLDKSKRENRPVFYNGIELLEPDYFPNWQPFEDAEKWHELPDGSLIFIDECQRVFRPRANGAQVPKHVSEFETHRHKGYDVYLVTQHPLLVDQNIRRLAGQHFHVNRTFGMRRAVIHEWQKVNEKPDKSLKDSVRHDWGYPNTIIGKYKSTSLDTYKARVPMKMIMAVILVVLMLAGGVGGFFYWKHSMMGTMMGQKESGAASQPVAAGQGMAAASPGQDRSHKRTVAEYMADQKPRIDGLAYTAPEYDDLTKAQQVPAPQACVEMAGHCKCYTNQATPLNMDDTLCRQIVKNGIFLPFQPPNTAGAAPVTAQRRDEPATAAGAPARPAPAQAVAHPA